MVIFNSYVSHYQRVVIKWFSMELPVSSKMRWNLLQPYFHDLPLRKNKTHKLTQHMSCSWKTILHLFHIQSLGSLLVAPFQMPFFQAIFKDSTMEKRPHSHGWDDLTTSRPGVLGFRHVALGRRNIFSESRKLFRGALPRQ